MISSGIRQGSWGYFRWGNIKPIEKNGLGVVAAKMIVYAGEAFDRLQLSLNSFGYDFPLIGFNWDSDTEIDLEGIGWNIAKYIAKENEPKLAQFILDLKNHCMEVTSNDIHLRLLGHSLGSRVILSSIQSLDNNNEWISNFKWV
ncbi:hypothetical protein BH23THE1_BH23THE1_00050 [soil metagenome]